MLQASYSRAESIEKTLQKARRGTINYRTSPRNELEMQIIQLDAPGKPGKDSGDPRDQSENKSAFGPDL